MRKDSSQPILHAAQQQAMHHHHHQAATNIFNSPSHGNLNLGGYAAYGGGNAMNANANPTHHGVAQYGLSASPPNALCPSPNTAAAAAASALQAQAFLQAAAAAAVAVQQQQQQQQKINKSGYSQSQSFTNSQQFIPQQVMAPPQPPPPPPPPTQPPQSVTSSSSSQILAARDQFTSLDDYGYQVEPPQGLYSSASAAKLSQLKKSTSSSGSRTNLSALQPPPTLVPSNAVDDQDDPNDIEQVCLIN